jgi:hypothetical protein
VEAGDLRSDRIGKVVGMKSYRVTCHLYMSDSDPDPLTHGVRGPVFFFSTEMAMGELLCVDRRLPQDTEKGEERVGRYCAALRKTLKIFLKFSRTLIPVVTLKRRSIGTLTRSYSFNLRSRGGDPPRKWDRDFK